MNVDYEFNPHREDDMITTVEGLEQFYLLIPDHVKFVYFVFFMLHSSKHVDVDHQCSGERRGR